MWSPVVNETTESALSAYLSGLPRPNVIYCTTLAMYIICDCTPFVKPVLSLMAEHAEHCMV